MSKVAQYLQEHLLGEVISSTAVRRHFATDGSVLQMTPSVVVYPRGESDVRKTARFAWQLAERGRVLPITARGSGTDQAGAAIGSGIILVFPAHMNRILVLDNKSGVVMVEPGINYGKLQQTLQTHGRFLPPFPASFEYSTVGGAVGNNAGGEKSIKYGDTRQYVKSLRVVLANGEVIETGRISKRELNKKLGLATFEGEVYRGLDALLEESRSIIDDAKRNISKNATGYELTGVKRKDGSVDLTPLFVGSQGTLGVITEITLTTEPENPETTLFAAYFDSMQNAVKAVQELRDLADKPSSIELVDEQLLQMVEQLSPNQLKELVEKPLPKAVLLVEFDNGHARMQKKAAKKAQKIFDKYASSSRVETSPAEQEKLWRIRHASATVLSHAEGNLRAVPVIEDGIVPVDRLEIYIAGIYQLFKKHQLNVAVWGHAGDGNLHVQPFLDLAQIGDRQKLFRLMDEYHRFIIKLGGALSASNGDGRLRAPYLPYVYGSEMFTVMQKTKHIFDPHNILNPGVKFDTSLDDLKGMLRQDYSLGHLYNHLPRT